MMMILKISYLIFISFFLSIPLSLFLLNRIVDLETMQVRVGPKLPFSGGACGAAPIQAISGEPPLICSFGGTDGNHDKGKYYVK